jgi:hypothetical protein
MMFFRCRTDASRRADAEWSKICASFLDRLLRRFRRRAVPGKGAGEKRLMQQTRAEGAVLALVERGVG